MKKFLLCAGKVILSGIIAVLLLSVFCFFYDNTPFATEQPSGITNLRYIPNSWWSYMKEGFAFGRTNNIGYNSQSDFQEDSNGIVAFLGSSHTEAFQVPQSESFVALTQEKLLADSNGDNDFLCLNFGISSHYLNVIASNFEAFAEEYDNVACVVIEVNNIDYSEEAFQRMLDGEYREPYREKGAMAKILQRIPFVRSLKKQVEGVFKQNKERPLQEDSQPADLIAYAKGLNPVMEKISSIAQAKGFPVVIVYHPSFGLDDWEGLIRMDNQEMVDIFQAACEKNAISFIDISAACMEHYRTTYAPPAGFANTVMASGHLNATGHSIISDAIYQKLCELKTGDCHGF